MKVAALLSGGKDSCYNMLECVKRGHEIVCLVNLLPENQNVNELDSFMYQTIGHTAIDAIAEAMEIPLLRFKICGTCLESEMKYNPHSGDEVEDLFLALKQVKEQFPYVEGVSSGAILSNYQRERVENVCSRLNLISIAYLWEREQRSLLRSMIEDGLVAVIIKTAAMGLDRRHVGKTLQELEPYLLHISDIYGCNPCGEGGEYETFTIDCPLFKRRIVFDDSEVVVHSNDVDAPVILLVPHKWHLEEKQESPIQRLPSPIAQSPSDDLCDSLSSILDSNHVVMSDDHDVSIPSFSDNATHLTVIASSPSVLHHLLSQLSSQPTITPIISCSVGSTCRCYSQSLPSTQLITWMSRSLWCPPPLDSYSLISVTSRYISIPMILPLQSDSLIFTAISTDESLSLCEDYEQKMLKKAHNDSHPVIATLLHNRKWGKNDVSFQKPHSVLIEGTTDDILGDCRVQLGVDAYYRDSYVDDCKEEIQVDDSSWSFTYGDHLKISVKWFCDDDIVTIQKQASNELVTVYCDVEDTNWLLDCVDNTVPVIPVRDLCVQICHEEKKHCRAVVKCIAVF